MLRFLFYGFLLVLVCACSTTDIAEVAEGIDLRFTNQKWELVRMSGNFVGSETVGEAMEWQEFYVFSPDGTFFKSSERGGIRTEATGTFTAVEFTDDVSDYLELVYKTGEVLIGNCTEDTKEILVYRSSKQLSNTWQACDGPGLDYRLVED